MTSFSIRLTTNFANYVFKPGIPRTKEDTVTTLQNFSEKAKTLYSKTALTKARTQTGVKDTFQEFFFDRLFSSYKHKRGIDKQRALDEAICALPDEITSPIWRLGEQHTSFRP